MAHFRSARRRILFHISQSEFVEEFRLLDSIDQRGYTAWAKCADRARTRGSPEAHSGSRVP